MKTTYTLSAAEIEWAIRRAFNLQGLTIPNGCELEWDWETQGVVKPIRVRATIDSAFKTESGE